jgi:hypothetical protein
VHRRIERFRRQRSPATTSVSTEVLPASAAGRRVRHRSGTALVPAVGGADVPRCIRSLRGAETDVPERGAVRTWVPAATVEDYYA